MSGVGARQVVKQKPTAKQRWTDDWSSSSDEEDGGNKKNKVVADKVDRRFRVRQHPPN